MTNGVIYFEVSGPIYTNYIIWSSSDLGEAVTYSDDASEPLPSLDLEFGDIIVPAVPATIPTGGL